MYEKLFDIVKKNGLESNDRIEKAIMADLTLSKLLNLVEELYRAIEFEAMSPEVSGLKDYDFLVNSNMSSVYDAGCHDWECRLYRIDHRARFATLYSDSVYIHNYFHGFEHIDKNLKDLYEEQRFRDSIAGSLKIINNLKPLIINGIVRFTPSVIMLCSHCKAKLIEKIQSVDKRLEKAIESLDDYYSRNTTAKLLVLPSPSPIDGHKYELHVKCDEDLFEHGGYWALASNLPHILLRKIEKKPLKNEFQLSQNEILKGQVNTQLLHSISNDLSLLQIYYTNSKLKYLTNRRIDISLLKATTEYEYFSRQNDILQNNIMFEMPIFQNISIDSLLKIRSSEYEAFRTYQKTINDLINEYIAQKADISPAIAKEIYSDIIHPKVILLDQKVHSIRKSSLLKSLAKITISMGVLTFGLCTNYVSPLLQSALVSLGLGGTASTLKSLPSSFKTPSEIQNNNLYFLWKLSKKSKVI